MKDHGYAVYLYFNYDDYPSNSGNWFDETSVGTPDCGRTK
jgi:hypothetical protein